MSDGGGSFIFTIISRNIAANYRKCKKKKKGKTSTENTTNYDKAGDKRGVAVVRFVTYLFVENPIKVQ